MIYYVTRQLSRAIDKLREDLLASFTQLGSYLHKIENTLHAIDENAKAYHDKEHPSAQVIATLYEEKSAQDERRTTSDKTQWRDRARLAVEILTLLAVAGYGYVTIRMWREMIQARHQVAAASKQTDQLICLYQQQLAQLTKQVGDIHELAGHMKDQADRTKDLADAMKGEISATGSVADQTKAIAAQALAQAEASGEIATTTEKQLTAFKDVQAAQLSIENISMNEDSEASFVLVNRGNSVALDINEQGGSSERTTNIGSAEVQRIDEDEARLQVKPSIRGFTLGMGDKKTYTYKFGLPHGIWTVKFGYLDIFGRERAAYSCLIRAEGDVLPCHLATENKKGYQQQNPNGTN
jgi:hypothetical protein